MTPRRAKTLALAGIFQSASLADALAWACSDAMTVDAALVTLDFALRHRLLPAPQALRLNEGLCALRVHDAHPSVQPI